MSDLVAFLRARLDEDEAEARAAEGRWIAADGTRIEAEGDGTLARMAVPSGMYAQRRAAAAHIVRWDPARVLAEVAAKRAILDEHAADPDALGLCQMCGCGDHYRVKVPCPTLRIIAQPYAGHPEFDPAWRFDPDWRINA